MQIKCTSWDEDIAFLSILPNTIITAKVFNQALIHSNLFDAHVSKHGNYKNQTLSDLVLKKYKKPFVGAIIEGIFNVFTMYYQCICLFFNVFSMYLQCIFDVFSMYYRCIFNVFSMYLLCIFNVLTMYFQCIFDVFSMFF